LKLTDLTIHAGKPADNQVMYRNESVPHFAARGSANYNRLSLIERAYDSKEPGQQRSRALVQMTKL
jgi:hypothetical protein